MDTNYDSDTLYLLTDRDTRRTCVRAGRDLLADSSDARGCDVRVATIAEVRADAVDGEDWSGGWRCADGTL